MAPDRRRAWGLVGSWLAAMLVLTSVPGDALPEPGWLPPRVDLLVHGGMYAVLGVLVSRALGGELPVRALLAAWAAMTAWGTLDELHQLLVPGREAAALDWALNALGGALGLAAANHLMRTRFRTWLA